MASFKEAFAAARKAKGAGASFEWNGKTYSTNRADDAKSTPTKPKARPTQAPKKPAAATPDKAPKKPSAPSKGPSVMSTAPAQPKAPTSGAKVTVTAAAKPAPKAGAKVDTKAAMANARSMGKAGDPGKSKRAQAKFTGNPVSALGRLKAALTPKKATPARKRGG